MKTQTANTSSLFTPAACRLPLALLCLILLHCSLCPQVAGQTTAFTYQGQLYTNTAAASGSNDLRFVLFDDALAGTQISTNITVDDVVMTNGLFTVTLDWGTAAQFDGSDRWLEIRVRPGSAAGAFTTLSPRQKITSTPYALTARQVTGTVSAGQLTGTLPASTIAAGMITSNMLAAGSVTSSQLAAGSVTTGSLADGAVTGPKIATNLLTATLTNRLLVAEENVSSSLGIQIGAPLALLGGNRLTVGTKSDKVQLMNLQGGLLATITNPVPGNYFGTALAAVGTDWVLAGETMNFSLNDGGRAYLFNTNGTALLTLTNPFHAPGLSHRFGTAVAAVGGQRMLISDSQASVSGIYGGAVYLYLTNGTRLVNMTSPAPASLTGFGSTVATVGNDLLAVSEPGFAGRGGVHLFNTNGIFLRTITNLDTTAGNFGTSLQPFGSNRILIGNSYSPSAAAGGAAFLYSTNGTLLTVFENTGGITVSGFGSSVAALGMDKVVVGAAYSTGFNSYPPGKAFVFDTNGTLLTVLAHPAYTNASGFGSAVTTVGGTNIVVGSPWNTSGNTRGAIFIFDLTNSVGGLRADSVANASITSASLADGSIKDEDIGLNAAISDAKLATIATAGKVANSATTATTNNLPNTLVLRDAAGSFAAGQITATNFTGNGGGLTNLPAASLTGTIAAANIGASSISSASITDGVIVNADINAAAAIADTKLATLATAGKVANSATTATSSNVVNTIVARDADGNISVGDISGSRLNIGANHQLTGNLASIGAGNGNTNQGLRAFIAGGLNNFIQTNAGGSFIGGGQANLVQSGSASAFIGGGEANSAASDRAFIGAGQGNSIATNAGWAVIPGGRDNAVAGDYGLAAGRRAKANQSGTFVWADAQNADFASGISNTFLIRAQNGVGINKTNPATALDVNGTITATAFSGNGTGLTNVSFSSIAAGSVSNVALATGAVDSAKILDGTITTNDLSPAVLDSTFWKLGGNTGITSAQFLGTRDGQPLDLRVNGQTALRLQDNGDSDDPGTTPDGAPNVIAGAAPNFVAAGVVGAVIAGGGATNYQGSASSNSLAANFSAIGGGLNNFVSSGAVFSTLAGGLNNSVNSNSAYAAISGGISNTIGSSVIFAAIGGGGMNTIQSGADATAIGGGSANVIQADADTATIGGGSANVIQNNSLFATIAGGSGGTVVSNAAGAFVGGGFRNQNAAPHGVVAGGAYNTLGYSIGAGMVSGVSNVLATGASYALLAGGSDNQIQSNAVGSVLAGGTANVIQPNAQFAVIGGGGLNAIGRDAFSAVIGGGGRNTNQAVNSFIGGGAVNLIASNAPLSGIMAGVSNSIQAGVSYSAIMGGSGNTVETNGAFASIGGGFNNSVLAGASYATIPGGRANTAAGDYAFAAGRRAGANHAGAFVWADSQNAAFNSSGANQFLIRAAGGVGINKTNPATALDVAGTVNATTFTGAFVGDGSSLSNITASVAVITNSDLIVQRLLVGAGNVLDGIYSGISGGLYNTNLAGLSIIAGGVGNTIQYVAPYSSIGGGYHNRIETNAGGSIIGGGWQNQIRQQSADSTIAGGKNNIIDVNTENATIGGGIDNLIGSESRYSTITGGSQNEIGTNALWVWLGGGFNNRINGGAEAAVVAGGYSNRIFTNAANSVIAGGQANVISNSATMSVVAGGSGNKILGSSDYSVLGGGYANRTLENADYATIPGGRENVATNYAFAAGFRAQAAHFGAFVWSDSTGATTASITNDSVTMRARGGYRLFSDSTSTAGVSLASGGTSWAVISDRNVKKDFATVDGVAILEKLAALPVTQWRYAWEETSTTPHIGPMAQDFKHAFYPGSDDKTITTLEADGVAFAAIQGLNQKLTEQAAALKNKDSEIQELRQAVAELQEVVRKISPSTPN